ncbi:hypothetical protein V1514DRAFT_123469 [Lipomyces japonicus]|uniref:uncharacterized protein n=1 Tax=Lipomyces japonicus TaxID=56871 RepID=UPI0034D0137E
MSLGALHVLPAGALLLRDENTLHFLSPNTLAPLRQPAAFDALSSVLPRPKSPSSFACVQFTPECAVSVWKYVSGSQPDDLLCIQPHTIVSLESSKLSRCCWNNTGELLFFGLNSGRVALIAISEPDSNSTDKEVVIFNTPDGTSVAAVSASPHTFDVFALALSSGRTFICRFSIDTGQYEVLHTLPDLAGRAVTAMAFHPTSDSPEALMLAMLHSTNENEPIQLWCINLGKSVNLIRRLGHKKLVQESSTQKEDVLNFLKWSKNGRVVQYTQNSLVVYDVRKNNGVYELINAPKGASMLAVDLLRENGLAWILYDNLEVYVYDLIHCNEISRAKVLFQYSTPMNSFSPTLLSDEGPVFLQRQSTEILSYYLSRSLDYEEESHDDISRDFLDIENDDLAETKRIMDIYQINNDTHGYRSAGLPPTAIRATSPLWTFAEPEFIQGALKEEAGPELTIDYLPENIGPRTAIPLDLCSAPAQQQSTNSLPDPILPDCLFMNLGDLMVSGINQQTSTTIADILFGWKSESVSFDARNIIKWEISRLHEQTALFTKMILNLWLPDTTIKPARRLETILYELENYISMKNMTVSITWLVYAIHLTAACQLKNDHRNESQDLIRIFKDLALLKNKDGYGDDVEAMHLAAGMMVACGLVNEAREIYRTNAYFMEATVLSLVFGLKMDDILREWEAQAISRGHSQIAIR